MDESEQKNKLNKLERKLYSRNAPDIINARRSDLSPTEDQGDQDVNTSWQAQNDNKLDILTSKISQVAHKRGSFVKKFFLLAIILFLISSAGAAFVFFGGVNLISSENVDIKIVGPVSIGGGQETSFDITIVNGTNTPLDSANLLIEYPLGTRLPGDLSKDLSRERFVIGSIESGESYTQTIAPVFFGEKESVKQIKISLEYRVKNSSATFFKEKVHEVSISSAPLILSAIYPKEVNSNQEITFNVEVASNSKDTINNLLLKIEYPFGFVFKSATPEPLAHDNTWSFESLKAGDKRTISVSGTIIGQDNEEKVFRVGAGIASPDDDREILVYISELTESVLLKKPFLDLEVSVGGKNADYAGRGGVPVETFIVLRNNLSSRLFNTMVEVSFSGGAFDQLSVNPSQGGFFRSSDNTISWDSRSVLEFGDLAPGAEERLSFKLTPLQYNSIPKGVRPEIKMTIKAAGERVLESGSAESVNTALSRKITLATDVLLFSKVVRSEGNFENSGPIPPKANIPSTYTIIWSLSNSFNQVSNTEVRAKLPTYVRWTNLSSPQNENFTFNSITNELIWNAGTILPNTGFGPNSKQVYFQIEFIPSTSQIGTTPVLVGEATLIGTDKVTGAQLGVSAPSATTNFFGDPTFKMIDDKVVP